MDWYHPGANQENILLGYLFAAYVNRDDGEQVLLAQFLREDKPSIYSLDFTFWRSWELSARWNYGAAFHLPLRKDFMDHLTR
jgi:hypothetical protein